MGWKQWTRERLAAADLQQYIQNQVVARFPSASSRAAAIVAPEVGMMSTLDDTGQVQRYYGAPVSGWRDISRGTCYGKMWRTSGVSAALGLNADVTVGMDAGRVAGGFTFDAVGDTLTIPFDGLYQITANGYGSGGNGWDHLYRVFRIRASVADAAVLGWMLHKHSGFDEQAGSRTVGSVPLKAGDKLSLKVFAYIAGGSYFGQTETDLGVAAEWLAPLPTGVTPL